MEIPESVRTEMTRGDKPRDIHHLREGILPRRHVETKGCSSSYVCFPTPGRWVESGGEVSGPFIMFSPKQLLCKQTGLIVG